MPPSIRAKKAWCAMDSEGKRKRPEDPHTIPYKLTPIINPMLKPPALAGVSDERRYL
jgi:hypothetical protein